MTRPLRFNGEQGLEFRRTPYLDSLLRGRAADDPLALQFLPDSREMNSLAYESGDPIGDGAHNPVPGIVHRYPDRVLLKVAHACAVYCRFCFRREMIGSKGTGLMGDALDAAIGYIQGRPEVWEVILTGGDPFTLAARRLGDIVRRLAAIAHVSVIRIHSRAAKLELPRLLCGRFGRRPEGRRRSERHAMMRPRVRATWA